MGLIFGSGKIPWREKWQSTPVFLLGKFHGQRRLVGHSPWGCKELDMTEHAGPQCLLLFSGSVMCDSFATLWTAACQVSLSFTISRSLPKFMSTESVMPSNHLMLWHPCLLLPSLFPSIRVFPNQLAPHIRWPNYWGFSFSISPSNEYSGLISFRMDWFDLTAVQGTLKSLLQHHSSKVSILPALSHLYCSTSTSIHNY